MLLRVEDKERTQNAHQETERGKPTALSALQPNSNCSQTENRPEIADNENDPAKQILMILEAVEPFARKVGTFLRSSHSCITALATVSIAVLTGFYACYSCRQWNQMKISASAAKSAAETAEQTLGLIQIQQRALVALENPPTIDKSDNSVTWAVENFGKSVASQVRLAQDWAKTYEDVPVVQDRLCEVMATTGANRLENWEVLVPRQKGASRKRKASVRGAKIADLYFVGCIRYADPFSEERWTKFCYQTSVTEPDNMISCLGYNSIDVDQIPKRKKQKD
jgi:hypothetical protein